MSETLLALLQPVAAYYNGEAPEMYADEEEELIDVLIGMGLLWHDTINGCLQHV